MLGRFATRSTAGSPDLTVDENFDLELGQFYNMLVQDDWCAIRYNVFVTNKHTGDTLEQMTMEFVQFKDNPEPIGARVVEGWAISDVGLG